MIAVLVVATVGVAVAAWGGHQRGGWTDRSLQVVGSPIDVDGTIVILDVTPGRELELSGIRPTSGALAWSHPFSASQITPGVAFTPVAIGGVVLLAAPATGPRDPLVTVEGVSAASGRVLWSLPDPLVLSDAPVVCGSGTYFCLPAFSSPTTTGLLAVRPQSGAVVGATTGPTRNMAVAPPGSINDGDLWQTSAGAPTFAQTSQTGQELWTASVADLFGGTQYDPDYGWDFLVSGSLDVGSVGVAPTGDSEPLDGFKTVGISTTTGAVAWSVPGYFLCGGGLQFLTSSVVCQYTGTEHASGRSASMTGVGLTLRGLDETSGSVTWSRAVLDPESLSEGTGVAFSDGSHLVVRLVGGQRVVLDTDTGSDAPAGAGVFWCEQVPNYHVTTPPGASVDGERTGEPVFRSCSATGAPVSGTPATRPTTVGVTVGPLFVWPTPTGLRAEPAAG